MSEVCVRTTLSEPKVSIIVPAFNASAYLCSCLDSLLGQAEDRIEVIAINDGSTDDTLDILLKYQERDGRIIVLNQQNAGVSAARNAGIEAARGSYLAFVDADDIVSKEFVRVLLDGIERYGAQCCSVGVSPFYSDRGGYSSGQYVSLDAVNPAIAIFGESKGFLANKIYLRSLILENNIRLDTTIHQCEDMQFNLDYLTRCKTLVHYSGVLYLYRQHSRNASNDLNRESWFSCVSVFERVLDSFSEDDDGLDIARKHLLPLVYEGEYRYRRLGLSDESLKNRLDAVRLQCEKSLEKMPAKLKLKMLMYRYLAGMIFSRRQRS